MKAKLGPVVKKLNKHIVTQDIAQENLSLKETKITWKRHNGSKCEHRYMKVNTLCCLNITNSVRTSKILESDKESVA